MSWRVLVVRSVQKAKPAEIHVFKRVRPATKEGAAHAMDKHQMLVTGRTDSLSRKRIVSLAYGYDLLCDAAAIKRHASHEKEKF